MERTTNRVPEDTQVTLKRECLLRQGNSVSNSGLPSLEGRQLAWEASALPLSYTRTLNPHVDNTPKRMEKQVVDRLTIENLIPTNSTESLAKGYILNCRSEGKSPNTIIIYKTVLRNFIWYCKQNNFPETGHLTPAHIRHFLLYLSTETNRWGSGNPATKKPAGRTTVSGYYTLLLVITLAYSGLY